MSEGLMQPDCGVPDMSHYDVEQPTATAQVL
jgi:hypothetical protein